MLRRWMRLKGVSRTQRMRRRRLLEANVGGALDEVGCHAIGNAGQRAHGAGQDNHSVGGSAAAGDAGPDVCLRVLDNLGVRAVVGAEEFLCECVASAELHLFGEDAQRCLAGDEVYIGDARVGVEGAQHLGGKYGTAGPGDGEDESCIRVHKSDYLPEPVGWPHPLRYKRFFAAPREVTGKLTPEAVHADCRATLVRVDITSTPEPMPSGSSECIRSSGTSSQAPHRVCA